MLRPFHYSQVPARDQHQEALPEQREIELGGGKWLFFCIATLKMFIEFLLKVVRKLRSRGEVVVIWIELRDLSTRLPDPR